VEAVITVTLGDVTVTLGEDGTAIALGAILGIVVVCVVYIVAILHLVAEELRLKRRAARGRVKLRDTLDARENQPWTERDR
jgi:hypothetical protein